MAEAHRVVSVGVRMTDVIQVNCTSAAFSPPNQKDLPRVAILLSGMASLKAILGSVHHTAQFGNAPEPQSNDPRSFHLH